jgi:hypothetical protein
MCYTQSWICIVVELKSRELAGWTAYKKMQAAQRGFSTQRLPAALSRRRCVWIGLIVLVYLFLVRLGVRVVCGVQRRAEAEDMEI